MEGSFIASILALALAVCAVGVAGVSLWFQRSPPDVSALKSRVENLDLDVTELADRINHWMRRDATRAARAGRDFPPPVPVPLSPAEAKKELRRRAGINGGAL